MLMVQKQPNFSLSQSPAMFHHRRHPSAPPAVVVVQPTRTPGLLSLAKPQQQRSQRQQRPTAKPTIVKHQLQTPLSAPETPSPAPRGRQPKDKAPSSRSGSLKTSHRQPSPPKPAPSQSKSSQAEGPTTPTTLSTNSDPFLVSSPTSPTLSTRPSGKLARRRQQQKQQQSPALSHSTASKHTKPVSIPPSSVQTKAKPLSLSVPPPRQRSSKQQRSSARNSTNTNAYLRDFPICDDMTEVGDVSDTDVAPSPPRTPTHTRNPPAYAPPSPSPTTYTRGSSAPAFTPPAVLSAAGNGTSTRGSGRSHRRAPSEGGVFHMSSDEGSAGEESFSTFKRPVDTQAFLDSLARNSQHRHFGGKTRNSPPKAVGSGSHSRSTVGLSSSAPYMSSFGVHTPVSNAMKERERQLEAQAQAQQAGYFASSSFQNSPSPEDLPDPLLI